MGQTLGLAQRVRPSLPLFQRPITSPNASDPTGYRLEAPVATLGFRCQSQVQVVICPSDPLAPMVPFLVLINWLEQLTEPETLYLLDHLFIIKDVRWEQPDATGRVHGASMHWTAPWSPNSRWPPNQKLSAPRPFGYLQRLHHIGMAG